MNEFRLDTTSAFDLSSLRGALEESLPDTVLARRAALQTYKTIIAADGLPDDDDYLGHVESSIARETQAMLCDVRLKHDWTTLPKAKDGVDGGFSNPPPEL